ncbi:MAG TPA: alpha/beta fold hydrolase [Holophagaceae bacterium]|nr:alpha/beta fold hydrolase [Holophagaceae bacterium]
MIEQLLRRTVAFLERVHPPATGRLAQTLFITPPRHTPSARERESLRHMTPLRIPYRGGTLLAHSRGKGPLVLLLHGWGGRGGQMRAFAAGLADADFRAVVLDAPAHGGSPGWQAGIPQFAEALKAAEAHLGPIHGVVGHSLGGISTLVALAEGLEARRAVVVAAPAHPRRFYRQLLERLGVEDRRWPELEAAFERHVGRSFEEVEGPALARRLTTPLLVVHDDQDREVPMEEAVDTASAHPGAQLLPTTGLGHRRILKDPAVIREVVRFMGGEPCGPSRLERELACPDLRD